MFVTCYLLFAVRMFIFMLIQKQKEHDMRENRLSSNQGCSERLEEPRLC